jgi:tetratricopeptide (TPR) repeat protein
MRFMIRCLAVCGFALAWVQLVEARTLSEEYLDLRRMVGRAEYDAALERCKAMIVQYPKEGVLYEGLAEIAQYAGRIDDAMSFLWERVEDGTGLSMCYFALGNLSYRREDDRNAVMFLSKAIELGVEVPECYSYFVYAYERLEGVDATLRLLTSLCHRQPKRANYWYGLALAYWSNADFSNVLMCINEAAGLAPAEPMFREVRAAIRLVTGGQRAGASEILTLADQALARNDIPHHCFLSAQLVQLNFKESNYRRADSIANHIISTSRQFGYRRWAGWGYQQVGEAAFLCGEYDKALLSLQNALAYAQKAGDQNLVELILSCTFEVHNERGDLYAACLTAQRRVESESRSPRSRAFVRSMNDMACILNSIGLYDLALDFAVEALSLADQLRLDGRVRCELNTTVGMIHLNLGDLRTASRHLDIADELVRDEPYYYKVKSVTIGNLGELELARGRYVEAERCFKKQKLMAMRGHFARQIAGAYLNLGALEQARGNHETALGYFHLAYAHSVGIDLMPIVTQSIVRMAQVHEILGERPQAIRWHRTLDSLSYAKRQMGWYWGDWSMDKWMARSIKEHAILLSRDGKPLEAWREAETVAQERSWLVTASLSGSGNGSKLSKIDWAAQKILDYGQSVAKQGPNRIAAPTDLHMLISRSGIVAAELSRRAALAEGLKHSLWYGARSTDKEFVGRVRNILRSNGVFVQFLVGQSSTLVICVSPDTVLSKEVRLGADELQLLMAKVSPVFSSSGQGASIWNGAMADFDVSPNVCLRDSIWGPIRDVAGHFPLVYVVPDGPLTAFPLEILVEGQGALGSGMSFDNLSFLVRDRAFSYHASATALIASEELIMSDHHVGVVGFGDPEINIDRNHYELSAGMTSHYATRIHLPESRDEIEGMKRIYRSAFEGKIGLAATEMGVKDAFSTARIVHVAAHAFVDREIAFLSRIRLASDSSSKDDGPFHTFEFVGIVPPTPVLILSGCNTLSVSGVSNSFRDGADIRTAPAQVTIGSLWNVDDHMASLLMQKFHKHLAMGVTIAEALSLAKNELIKEGESDPFDWGAFVVVGRLPWSVQVVSTDIGSSKLEFGLAAVIYTLLAMLVLTVTGCYLYLSGCRKNAGALIWLLNGKRRGRE